MKPVNLLPASHRPYVASGEHKGSAYVLLGVLGVLLVGALLYVLTANQVSSRQADIAKAKVETASAQSRASKMANYGDFGTIAKTRVESVKSLAQQRLDYERLVREIAHVLPAGVWVTQFTASADGSDSSSSGGTPPAAGGEPGSTPAGPSVKISGCSDDQPAVATTLVRLRSLHDASDVQLQQSTKQDTPGGGSASGGSTSTQGCGTAYAFDAVVTLAPATDSTADKPGSVPARLGGGS